jgi:hypothetical protein
MIYKILILLLLFSCSQASIDQTNKLKLNIREENPTKWTALTKQNLLHLTQVYDLKSLLINKNFLITEKKRVESDKFIHLDIKHAESPLNLLYTVLFEEFSWRLKSQNFNRKELIQELQNHFPPFKKWHQNSTKNLSNLISLTLTYNTLIFLLGRNESEQLFQKLKRNNELNPWFYDFIQKNQSKLEIVLKKYDLILGLKH